MRSVAGVAARPAASSTIDSRHASRSSRILSVGPDQRELLDQLASAPPPPASSFLPVEVEVLDLRRPRPRSPCGSATSAWKFVPLRAHAAEVQRVHRAQHVGRRLDVVVDDQRHGRGDLEVVDAAPRAVAREALGQRVAVEALVARARRTAPASRRTARRPARCSSGPRRRGRSGCPRAAGGSMDFSGLPSPVPSGQRQRVVRARRW